ncbi:MAG: hypothetical protein JWO09_974 [Bacteroidetes bacterium]|nr:hypothetical protein [Bacteroidota bacterium]
MKALIRNDKTYPPSQLPELESHYFLHNGIKAYSGSIFKRPLKRNGLFTHYAFFLGFDHDGTVWMLENNEDGVECVTWNDFMSKSDRSELVHLEPDDSQFSEIIKRVIERSTLEYNAHLNNCEHFVNYCVLYNFKSHQADGMRNITDKLLSLVELSILKQTDSAFHESLEDYNEVRELLQLKRGNEKLDNKITEKIKHLNKNG